MAKPLPKYVNTDQLELFWPYSSRNLQRLGIKPDGKAGKQARYEVRKLLEPLRLTGLEKSDVLAACRAAWNGQPAFLRRQDIAAVFSIYTKTLKNSSWPNMRANSSYSHRIYLYGQALAFLTPLATAVDLEPELLFAQLRTGKRKLGTPRKLADALGKSAHFVEKCIKSGEIAVIRLPPPAAVTTVRRIHRRVLLPEK